MVPRLWMQQSLFSKFDENIREIVKLGDNSNIYVIRKGNIKIQMNNSIQTIIDVFCVLELKSNLISIGQLQEKVCTIVLKDNFCQFHHLKKGLIAQVTMTAKRMFPVYTQTS